MKMAFSLTIGAIAFFLLLALNLIQAQADDRAKIVTNNAATNATDKQPKAERVIGNKGKFLAGTKIIPTDNKLAEITIQVRKRMKEIRRISLDKEVGPQTIEAAAGYLSRKINMAYPPTKCFEYDGTFYFSGGTSANPIDDFSAGLAVRKGEAAIYEWTSLDDSNENEQQ